MTNNLLVVSIDVEADEGLRGDGGDPIAVAVVPRGSITYFHKADPLRVDMANGGRPQDHDCNIVFRPFFEGRVAKHDFKDAWVAKNVWPQCQTIRQVANDSAHLLQVFSDWWLQTQNNAKNGGIKLEVIAHCQNPVETGFFNKIHDRHWADSIRRYGYYGRGLEWLARPLPIHELGTILLLHGEDPTSVDKYIQKYGLTPPDGVGAHNPLYDAEAALIVFNHLTTSELGFPEIGL